MTIPDSWGFNAWDRVLKVAPQGVKGRILILWTDESGGVLTMQEVMEHAIQQATEESPSLSEVQIGELTDQSLVLTTIWTPLLLRAWQRLMDARWITKPSPTFAPKPFVG